MLKLLIFDLDGTLADTSRDIADAINYALTPFGSKTYTVEETKAMVGSGITNLFETLLNTLLKDKDRETIARARDDTVDRFLEYYSEHILDSTITYPHVKETLDQLTAYKKVVVSNKRELYLKRVLEGLGILKYFERVLGSDSVPERKPSPVPMLMLLKEFNVSKDEALVIGDSNYDIESAKAAGIRVIAVTYGFRTIDFLTAADIIIDSFDKLLTVLPELS